MQCLRCLPVSYRDCSLVTKTARTSEEPPPTSNLTITIATTTTGLYSVLLLLLLLLSLFCAITYFTDVSKV